MDIIKWFDWHDILTGIVSGVIAGYVVLSTERMGQGILGIFKWRKRRSWLREIEEAELLTSRVRRGEKMRGLNGSYIRNALDLHMRLKEATGCSFGLVSEDETIKEWLHCAKVSEEFRADAESGLKEGDFEKYQMEFVSGQIFMEWEERMPLGFRERYKTRIKNLQAVVKADIPRGGIYGGISPCDTDPTRFVHPYVRVLNADGCTEYFREDVVDIVSSGGSCPTGEHELGRKWESPGDSVGVHRYVASEGR